MKPRRPRADKQRGTLIVALMAGITIMVILSSVAAQKWSDVIRRDNEAEMMFRAQDIVRAIKRYQTLQGKFPVELKELMEPTPNQQIYVLRKLWKDPLVKGGKWQLLYLTPNGGLFDPTAPEGANPLDPTQQPSFPPSPLNPQGQQGQRGDQGSIGGDPFGNSNWGTRNKDSDPDDPGAGLGLPIVGVKSRCTDRPFRRYKEKDEYREWVFSVFDLQPQAGVPNPGNPQTPSGQTSLDPAK